MQLILVIVLVLFLMYYFTKKNEHFYDDRVYIRTQIDIPVKCNKGVYYRDPSYQDVDHYSIYPFFNVTQKIKSNYIPGYYPSFDNYAFVEPKN